MQPSSTRFVPLRILFLIISTLIISSCSSSGGKIVDPENKNVSLVYGYIEMREAAATLNWLHIRRYRPVPEKYIAGIYDGLFYHIGVEPGSYQVHRFGSSGGYRTSGKGFTFGSSGKNQTALVIKKPGMYFMGAYNYVNEKDRWGEYTKFSFKKTKTPTEKQLLTDLLRVLKSRYSDYTLQIKWVEQRLAKL